MHSDKTTVRARGSNGTTHNFNSCDDAEQLLDRPPQPFSSGILCVEKRAHPQQHCVG